MIVNDLFSDTGNYVFGQIDSQENYLYLFDENNNKFVYQGNLYSSEEIMKFCNTHSLSNYTEYSFDKQMRIFNGAF